MAGQPEEIDVEELPSQIVREEPPSALRRETARYVLALLLGLTFLGTVVLAFAGAQTSNWANTKELLDVLIPVEAALLGSALTFYFSTRNH
jgi:heme A synthase